MAAMSWTGQEAYLAAPTEKWMVDGKVAGSIKEYENLTVRLVLHRLGGGTDGWLVAVEGVWGGTFGPD